MSKKVDYKSRLIDTLRTYLSGLRGYDTMALELIQNADDAKAKEMVFDVKDSGLKVTNNAKFSYCRKIENKKCSRKKACDFHSILAVASGNKAQDSDNIGRFGIGFISTYQTTDQPKIISNGLSIVLNPETEKADPDEIDTIDTTFELPWARDPNSAIRKALEQEHIDDKKIEQFFFDCKSVLNQSLLFLKHLERIELKRNGLSKLVVKIKRQGKSPKKKLSISLMPEKKVEKWIVFDSKVEDSEIHKIYSKHPLLKSAKRKRRVQVAVKTDSKKIKQGLLYAYLPTQQPSQLPLHINADFYPESSRKSIILSGHQYDQQWNKLLLKEAAKIIANELENLRQHINHRQLFQIIEAAYKTDSIDEDSTFDEFWNCISRRIFEGAKVIYSSQHQYQNADEIFYDPGLGADNHVKKSSLEAFYKAGGMLVNEDLLRLSNDSIETLDALDVGELDIDTFATIINKSDQFSPEMLGKEVKNKDLKDTYKPLWAYANYLIGDSENAAPISRLSFILNPALFIKSVKQVYRAPSFIKNAKLSEMLSMGFFAHDELEQFNNIYESIDLFQLSSLIEELEERLDESLDKYLPSNLTELKALYEMIPELTVPKDQAHAEDLYALLKYLPIWRTNQGFENLQEILLPGDFEDPTGFASHLHPKCLSKPIQNFLEKKLGVQRQTIEAYIEFILPKYFSEDGPEDIEMYQKLMATFAGHKKLLKDESTLELLNETALIPTKSGEWKTPGEVYFYDKQLSQFIGNYEELWIDEKKLSKKDTIQKFVKKLGVLKEPLPQHLIEHMETLSEGNLPTKKIVERSSLIFDKLCELYLKHESSENISGWGYSNIRYIVLPIIGDHQNWHRATGSLGDEIFAPIKLKAFEYSSANILAYKPTSKFEDCENLFERIGVQTQIKFEYVVEHLQHCLDHKKSIHTDVFEALNQFSIENRHPASEVTSALRNFSNLPIIPLGKQKYVRPNQIFHENAAINQYTFLVPQAIKKYEDLLRNLGVEDEPNVNDYIQVLLNDLIKVENADKTTYKSCINYISEHQLDIQRFHSYQLDMLARHKSVLNDFGEFVSIEDILIDDSEWIKGYFLRENEELRWLTSLDVDWSALESLGLKKLSNFATLKLSYSKGNKLPEGDILKRIQDRQNLFIRALDKKPKETIRKLISCIENLKVVSYDSIKVQAIIDNHHNLNFSSLEKSEKAYFNVTDNELILSRPTSELSYVAKLKPILHSISPDSDDTEFRGLLAMFDAICMKEIHDAESYLDELNFKKNEDIDIEEDLIEKDEYNPNETDDIKPFEEEHDISTENDNSTVSEEALDDNFPNQEIDSENIGNSRSNRNKPPNEQVRNDNGGDTSSQRKPRERINPRERANRKPNDSNQQQYRTHVYTSNKQTDASNTEKSNNDRNLAIEKISRAKAIEHEKKSGRVVSEMPQNHPGFDLISSDVETGEVLRYIEVKGTTSTWGNKGVSVSYTQFSNAQDEHNKAWLYIVDDVDVETGKSSKLYRIQNYAMKATSFVYDSGWANMTEEEDKFAEYGPEVRIEYDGYGKGVIKKIDKSRLVPKLDIYFDDFDKTFPLSLNPKKIKIIKEED